jgi:hypothetical protein
MSDLLSILLLNYATERPESPSGTLADRLDALAKSGLLHSSLTEWAKEVRLVGNTGAHFDPLNPVSRTDAEQLVSFVREVLKFLYELPANLARRRRRSPE